ncbi:MAG: hypothetical protein U5K27_00870 [Desulfotignum sp.]|nr:hypothetical protein [Desulfotignum sp.]
MNMFTFSDQVSFSMDIAWSDHCDVHLDHYHVHRMNCWRDLEPGSFLFRISIRIRFWHPRPVDDRYFPQLRQSDPAFWVTGIVNK